MDVLGEAGLRMTNTAQHLPDTMAEDRDINRRPGKSAPHARTEHWQ